MAPSRTRMAVPMKRLQSADRALGRLVHPALLPLRWIRSRARARADEGPGAGGRVLLIKFWGIGSLQLLSPAVRAVRASHPGARVDLLTLRPNEPFARGLEAFDRVLTLDVTGAGWTRLFGRILHLVRRLRRERYDTVYDFEFFTRFSAVVSLLSGARTSHGFASPGDGRGSLHTHRAPFNRYWHVARNFRNLARGENGRGVSVAELSPFVVREEHRAEAAAVLFEHGFASDGPLVVLNPNAGSLSLERRWPAERFAALARTLVEEDGARVVLIGAASERARAAEIVGLCQDLSGPRFAPLAGRLSIGATASLLESCDVFVSNDSGPMHVAATLGTATIGLFGPETPVMYAPIGPRTRVLYEPPPCSPCINVHDNKLAVCVRGHAECMTSIETSSVLEAVRRELDPCAPRSDTGAATAAEPLETDSLGRRGEGTP